MRVYNVELPVIGPIMTEKTLNFNMVKELDLGNIFQSDILIKHHPLGIICASTVYTSSQDNALKVALVFIGRMLDILAIKTNSPLFVSTNDFRPIQNKDIVKAVIPKEEFISCFQLSRQLNLDQTAILRALNWYRKGLYTEDPFDKFLAFWNSINVIASVYHNVNERTNRGIINQIWDCFITLWGSNVNEWELINGGESWINDNNDIRNSIAHGAISVEINHVVEVISKLDTVRQVAFNFITQWSHRELGIQLI